MRHSMQFDLPCLSHTMAWQRSISDGGARVEVSRPGSPWIIEPHSEMCTPRDNSTRVLLVNLLRHYGQASRRARAPPTIDTMPEAVGLPGFWARFPFLLQVAQAD